MSQMTDDMKADVQKSLESLQTLRDEIRVRIHLAGMEAKDAWDKLEPKLLDAEQLAQNVSDASRSAITDLVQKVRDFRATLTS